MEGIKSCLDPSLPDLRMVQSTPTAMRVSRAQTFSAGCILFTGFNRNLTHLERKGIKQTLIQCHFSRPVYTANQENKAFTAELSVLSTQSLIKTPTILGQEGKKISPHFSPGEG